MPPRKRANAPSADEVLRKYGQKIESQIDTSSTSQAVSRGQGSGYTKAYSSFKQEMAPELSSYEKWARSLGRVVKVNVSEKDKEKVQKHLKNAHLDIEPYEALGLAIMSFVSLFFIGLIYSVANLLITGTFPFLFFVLAIMASVFVFYYLNNYPRRLANKWRLKASSQMVPAILYTVVYMRHTPNLEKAISFAADNLDKPLSLDFKQVFYGVEMGKFSTIKESLDNYLQSWKDYSPEFVEAFHLVESSLFEPDDARRIKTLEKSLQVVLDGVYEKMMKFSRNVKSPLTNVYMLAVMLPVLGIALIPLASAMVGGLLKGIHIFVMYNMIIPFVAFFMLDKILLKRPGGHGQSRVLEKNPLYKEYKDNSVYKSAFMIAFPMILLGLLPLIFQFTPIPGLLGIPTDFTFGEIGLGFLGENSKFFDFKTSDGGVAGPYGVGALLLGMFIPVGIATFFATAYNKKTKNLIKEREKTVELESEFNNSLFQLGNRLGNGSPPEIAFGKVAKAVKGSRTEEFFRKVNYNIRQMGMSVDKAIFNKQRGAIKDYPSGLISTSMRIMIESSKKGLNIAATSMMSISEYVKNIKKITQKLRDLLASTVSSMKSNMTFLAPLLSGIVIGLAAMITSILNKLQIAQQIGGGQSSQLLGGGMSNLLEIFNLTNVIPPYFLQIAIGIYLIEIIFILTGTLVTINSGQDKLEETNKIGKNLKKGIGLFFVTALLATLVLFGLSSVVLGGLGG
ncbi:MAG: hypothetical protein ABEI74_03150 [Candidatus Pacearchaeota archaeon]